MLLNDDQVEQDGLDDYDRARASDMDCRPIYPNLYLEGDQIPDDEEPNPDEREV